jgi:integrase
VARGSLRLKREPDYWELRAYAGTDPITARPRYVSRSFRGGKRDANKALAQLVAEIDSTGTQADQTVAGLLVAYIDHLEERGRAARTIESYRSIARKTSADRLGGKAIQDLGPKDFDDFYVRLRTNGLSPASIKRYHSVLGGAFQQAMKWGWTNRNVVRLATPPAVPRHSRTTPTPAVVTTLLREALESRNPENHVAFRLLAATGARRGEVCGLRWSSVDLDRRVLWIRHSIARLRTGKLIEKDPKSHQTREVAIDKNTTKILREHRKRQKSIATKFHTQFDPNGYVIADLATDPTGLTPISPDRLTQAFNRLTTRVPGAADVRLHDLRHWYASTQLDSGESLPAVAARIGDHVETLARVYAHRGHRGDHAAADTLGALIDNKP